jgi:deazaflavin-dependent oxidoreductase (nitroreductase family)
VREHLHRYVATDGADGHEWRPGVPTLLLTTRGRRSGKLRRTPLIYGRDGDAYVVVASFGGSPQHPDWYLNLADEPDVEIQVGEEVMPARATTAEGPDRERLWTRMTEIWPDYDKYQARTSRVLPVVTLEPAG